MTENNFDPEFASAADYARLYRDMGLQVVPSLSPRAGEQWKRPAVAWKPLEHELVNDPTFEGWFGSQGDFRRATNIGLITGSCSGRIIGVDLDHYKSLGSQAWWDTQMLLYNNGMDLETLTQITGGGGLTKFFRWPAGRPMPTAHKTPIGVDIRGQGGFIVIAPSRHESGSSYRWCEGLGPTEVEIAECPAWLCDAIEALIAQYGRAITQAAAVCGSNVEILPQPLKATNLLGEATDGREEAMYRLVWAACVDLRRDCPIPVGENESKVAMEAAFKRYLSSVTPRSRDLSIPKHIALEKEGRGITLFADKWNRAMAQWDTGLLEAASHPKQAEAGKSSAPSREFQPHLAGESREFRNQSATDSERKLTSTIGDLGEEIFYDAETGEIVEPPAPLPPVVEVDEFTEPGPRELRRFTIDDLVRMPKPRFLIEDMIIENGLGFLYGEPGCGKSFVALDLALSIAHGLGVWLGRYAGSKPRGVLYLAGEGSSGAKLRVMAWRSARHPELRDVPFEMIFESLNFMDPEDVDSLLRAVQGHVGRYGAPPAVVVVDTVSRVLPGARENLQEDMTLFVQACDRVREAFGTCVIGVAHTAKGGGSLRGSGVLLGAADFAFLLSRVEPGEEEPDGILRVTLRAAKIKDAADGWGMDIELRPVDCLDPAASVSLVPFLPEPEAGDDLALDKTPWRPGWPLTAQKSEQLLNDLRAASAAAAPWGYHPNTKKVGRHAVSEIVGRYGVTEKQADYMIETWLRSGVLTYFQYGGPGDTSRFPGTWKHKKVSGYDVTGMLGDGSGALQEMQRREGGELEAG